MVTSATGTDSAPAPVSQVAPEIFAISASQAAITNQDNTLNTPSNPAIRGTYLIIYATGFGAVGTSAGLNPAKTPLFVGIGSVEIVPAFAGLTPGSIGLYQVNILLPATVPPGLALPINLRQGGAVSTSLRVAVQ